jgi:aminoglycoside phosphotransferase (APT) family kinase protein
MTVMLKPALVLTDAQVQAIVDRAAPGRHVACVSAFGRGEISAVFDVELADGPPGLVIKIYPDSLHWKMQKEILVAGLMSTHRLAAPVPRILFADDSKSLIAFNYVVMDRLAGSSLADHERDLSEQECFAIYAGMGRLLRDIHAIPLESFGYIGAEGVVTPFATNRAYMSSQFARKLDGFSALGGTPEIAARLSDYVARSAALLDGCATPHLCHYDFHPGNVLADRQDGALRLTGLVDLENAIAGDPLMDVAKTLNYSVHGVEARRAGLLAGYRPIDRPHWEETLALYEFYGLLELWCWWKQIGDHERADSIVGQVASYASHKAK